MIVVTKTLSIHETELDFTASRSGGPGGQNVNKVSSRVTLFFDVSRSPRFGDADRALVRARLSSRLSKDGVLRVVSQKHRSQLENKQAAIERFVELLRGALAQAPPRVKTKATRAARARRIDEKKHRGNIKQERSKRISWGD